MQVDVLRKESSYTLPLLNNDSQDDSSIIQRTLCCFLECLCNFSYLKCISRIGIGSACVSIAATLGLFITGCVIADDQDNLGFKLMGIAIGTMFLAVCCFAIVFLPCYDGECHEGSRDYSSDIGGGGAMAF